LKIDLKADETAIRVVATNRGAGANAQFESRAVEVYVRKFVKSAPPGLKLEVLTPHDFRPTTNEPYVVSTKQVLVRATVTDDNPITAIEWKVGNRGWEPGRFEPDLTDPKVKYHTFAIDL